MEQWMAGIAIAPSARGVLLAVLAAAVFLTRPLATWHLYGRSKLRAMVLGILLASLSLLCYPFIHQEYAVTEIFCLRCFQGVCLAVYSSATVSLLVDSLPKGQSARGFAIFSLTLLLPYAVIPAVGESLIILLGNEVNLFAATAVLGIPALLTVPLLSNGSMKKESTKKEEKSAALMLQSLHPRVLGLVYLSCVTFSIMTNGAIFFMKGLCQIIGAQPAYFFTTYTSTIMLIRLLGNTFFDRLPCYPVTIFCSALLAFCTAFMAFCNGHTLIMLSIIYGVGLGLLYPLLAAIVCDRSSPELKSLHSNIMMAGFDLSGFLAPVIGGILLNAGFSYQAVFLSISISITVCGVSLFCDRILQRNATVHE